MKILNILPAYEPAWAFGGVVRCTSNLCRAMAKLDAEVSVYTTNTNGQGGLLPVPKGRPVDIGGVKVTYFPSTFGRNSVWDSRAMLQRLDRTVNDFDIVYASAIWQWIGIAAGHLARRHGVPYVVGLHGAFHPATLDKAKLKKRLYWYLFLKRCIRGACALHYSTEYERRVSMGFLPKKESFVIPNTVPVESLSCHSEAPFNICREFGIPNNRFLLLTVVRPDPDKRLDILLRAFAKVVKTIPEARLLIVGSCENEYGEKMKKLARELNIIDLTFWAGYQTGTALKACYSESDLFILASSHENFSMAAAEAMAAGLPVVLSKHIGVAEDVEQHEAGIVTEVDDNAISEAAVELFQNRDRLRAMGQNANKIANQLYKDEQVAHRMLRAFEDVLSNSRNPQCAWQ